MQSNITDARTDSGNVRQLPAAPGRHATLPQPIPGCSPLPVWLDTCRPMPERQQALSTAMRPASMIDRANCLGALALRYPVSSRTDAGTLDAQARYLAEDLEELPIEALRKACKLAALAHDFMPLASQIMKFAAPMMDNLRDDARHLREMAGDSRPEPQRLARPMATGELMAGLLASLSAGATDGDWSTTATPHAPDAGQRASRLETPATSDLSPAMRARLASQQADHGDAP